MTKYELTADQWRSQGGGMAPKLLVNVFFLNESMLLRGLNVQADMGSVPEFPRVSINADDTEVARKCAGIKGMRLICQREKILLLPPPPH